MQTVDEFQNNIEYFRNEIANIDKILLILTNEPRDNQNWGSVDDLFPNPNVQSKEDIREFILDIDNRLANLENIMTNLTT